MTVDYSEGKQVIQIGELGGNLQEGSLKTRP